MRQDLQQKLHAEFPYLFSQLHNEIEVGDGWYDIIYRMSWRICNYLVLSHGPASLEHLAATCVKEKFGGLRVYMTTSVPAVNDIISEAVEEAWRTCEKCGQAGSLRGEGWLVTLCDFCDGKPC